MKNRASLFKTKIFYLLILLWQNVLVPSNCVFLFSYQRFFCSFAARFGVFFIFPLLDLSLKYQSLKVNVSWVGQSTSAGGSNRPWCCSSSTPTINCSRAMIKDRCAEVGTLCFIFANLDLNIFTTGIIRKICRKQRITVSPRWKICEIKNCTIWWEMLNAVDKISTKKNFFFEEKKDTTWELDGAVRSRRGLGDGQKQDRQSSPTRLFCVLCSVTSYQFCMPI